HTRWPRDWSSDVCSADLAKLTAARERAAKLAEAFGERPGLVATAVRVSATRDVAAAEAELAKVKKAEANPTDPAAELAGSVKTRSEEGRGGKGGGGGGWR